MQVTFKAYDMRHSWKFNTPVSANLVLAEIRRIASTAIILDVKQNYATAIRSNQSINIRSIRFKSTRCNGRYARTKQSQLTRQVGKPSAIRFKKPRTIQELVAENNVND